MDRLGRRHRHRGRRHLRGPHRQGRHGGREPGRRHPVQHRRRVRARSTSATPIGCIEGDDAGVLGDLLGGTDEPAAEVPPPTPGRRPRRRPPSPRAAADPEPPGEPTAGPVAPCPGPARWRASTASTWPTVRGTGPEGRIMSPTSTPQRPYAPGPAPRRPAAAAAAAQPPSRPSHHVQAGREIRARSPPR